MSGNIEQNKASKSNSIPWCPNFCMTHQFPFSPTTFRSATSTGTEAKDRDDDACNSAT